MRDQFWQPYSYVAKFGSPWGTIFGKRGPLLAAKIGPEIGLGDQFWQLFVKIGPGELIFDFGVT